jgi:light-regulated signal transduction histidine kinase (bacteriophytochrome)
MIAQRCHSQADLETTVRVLQDELASTNHEVLLLTLELESRVAQRTKELSAANQELAREVAERRRAEEGIRQLNQVLARRATQLEAANQELEAFSYSVSHDLRTPLRHINGFAKLLREQREGKQDNEERELLVRIIEAGERMGKLIDDLLQFARVAKVDLVVAPFDLNELVAEVIREFEPEMWQRKVVLNCAQLPRVHADRALLRQVFVNLISNALKYTRARPVAQIEIGSQEGPEEIMCYVRDNGVGFNPRYADKLFGVFQRLHSNEEFEGTGIGLANVHRIITRHGGKIWAEGVPEQGACFYFSLPRP